MKKNIKYFAMAAVALLSMSACTNEIDEQSTPTGELQPVQFEMTMANTRTVTDAVSRNTSWKEGDAIGIFAYKAGTQEAKAINAKYVLNGEIWKAEAGSEIYPEEALDYYAYYPYQEGMENPEAIDIAALADQSAASGDDYGMSDVLAGQSKDVAAGQGNVKIPFSHMFAMVEVKVEGDKVTKQPTKVELKGMKLNAVLNIMSATPTATVKSDATVQDITMYYLSREGDADAQIAPFSFRAVVPAQEIAANTPLVAIYAPDENNKTYTMQHSEAVPYKAGVFRQLNVNIGTAKVSLTIPKGDLTISPWEPSDAIGGEGGEVVTPVESFELEFPADIENVITEEHKYGVWNTSNNNCENLNESYWFRREINFESPATTLTVSEGKLTLSISKSSNWNQSLVGYHYTGTFDRKYYYKVIFNVTSNTIGANNDGSCGLAISNSTDNKLFKLAPNKEFAQIGSIRANTVTNGTTKDLTVYVDFTQAATEGKATGNITNEEFTETNDADTKHVNIYLYNYARKLPAEGSVTNMLTINSVKIQKAELIESVSLSSK